MDKDEHILRILTKIKHKKYEHFVISRIIHDLISTDIKFTCQQLVRRPNNKRALLDIYFPQIKLSLEIDEEQHSTDKHKKLDAERSRDVIEAADIEEKRINASKDRSLVQIAKDTDNFIKYLRGKVSILKSKDNWIPWDFDNELTAQPYLNRGYIDSQDNVLLRRHVDVIELFGRKLNGHQSGGWRPPERFNLAMVWFPRLYKNTQWDNSLSDDGRIIIEKDLNATDGQRCYGEGHRRAVFARKEEPLIGTLYRFVGIFEYSIEESAKQGAAIYLKTENRLYL